MSSDDARHQATARRIAERIRAEVVAPADECFPRALAAAAAMDDAVAHRPFAEVTPEMAAAVIALMRPRTDREVRTDLIMARMATYGGPQSVEL